MWVLRAGRLLAAAGCWPGNSGRLRWISRCRKRAWVAIVRVPHSVRVARRRCSARRGCPGPPHRRWGSRRRTRQPITTGRLDRRSLRTRSTGSGVCYRFSAALWRGRPASPGRRTLVPRRRRPRSCWFRSLLPARPSGHAATIRPLRSPARPLGSCAEPESRHSGYRSCIMSELSEIRRPCPLRLEVRTSPAHSPSSGNWRRSSKVVRLCWSMMS